MPIIADEIYEHMVFGGAESVAVSSLARTVPVLSCGGLSKRFLVPGWRLGWVVVHDPSGRDGVLKDVRKGLESMSARNICGNTLIQGALPAILRDTPQTFFDGVRHIPHTISLLSLFTEARTTCLRPFGSHSWPLSCAFERCHDDRHRCGRLSGASRRHGHHAGLVSEQSVFCLPGRVFDYPNYMRIVVTVPEDLLIEACNRIAEFCSQHYRSDNDEIISMTMC